MTDDTVILDLRDERGRFLAQPRLPRRTYASLLMLASLRGITFEELLHQAITEYAHIFVKQPPLVESNLV